MLKATLVGREETFRLLGIESCQEVELDALLITLQKQFGKKYFDTEDLGQEILEGLEAVRDDRVDHRNWREVLEDI